MALKVDMTAALQLGRKSYFVGSPYVPNLVLRAKTTAVLPYYELCCCSETFFYSSATVVVVPTPTIQHGLRMYSMYCTCSYITKYFTLFVLISSSAFSLGHGRNARALSMRPLFFLILFFSISLIADGPHHYHPACGHKGSSHLSPVHALQFFIAMQVQHSYNSSTNGWILLTHVPTLSATKERKQILLW